MNDLETKVELAGPQQDIIILRAKGLIDTNTARVFGKVLDDILKKRHFKIIVDMENVNYVSSAGWGIFIGEIRTIQSNGGDLKLAALSPEVDEVYRLLEFYNILKAFGSVEEALRDFT